MHELAIAQDLFTVVKEKAQENNLKKVTKVRIKLGVAAGIEEDFLRHSFVDHIFPQTIAQGAEIEIFKEELEARCKKCGREIDSETEFNTGCAECGSFNWEIIAGKDIYLETIEGD